nr:putative periplasmic protein [Kibdelosporangium sp. MJ126-NF4]CTQ96047.1 putative periplasmic protein [Kibdelosporangium sp. MJ126-NF4]
MRARTATGTPKTAGLALEEVVAHSSTAQFAAMPDGELDVAMTNPDNVVAYRCLPDNPLRRTADVRILGAVRRGDAPPRRSTTRATLPDDRAQRGQRPAGRSGGRAPARVTTSSRPPGAGARPHP